MQQVRHVPAGQADGYLALADMPIRADQAQHVAAEGRQVAGCAEVLQRLRWGGGRHLVHVSPLRLAQVRVLAKRQIDPVACPGAQALSAPRWVYLLASPRHACAWHRGITLLAVPLHHAREPQAPRRVLRLGQPCSGCRPYDGVRVADAEHL